MIISVNKFVAVVVVACTACPVLDLWAQDVTRIEIAKNVIATAPEDFEFARTGEGELGQWTVVHDPTANGEVAIQHVSTDQHDDPARDPAHVSS